MPDNTDNSKDHIFAETTILIRFLQHWDIDLKKWDLCIDKAMNGLPYAYSYYLDIASTERWDALIYGDYDAVFPLPYKSRLVFKQIYQPFFVQQLGLFFTKPQQQNLLDSFLQAIPAQFRKINLHLNIQNNINASGLKIKYKVTHHIPLTMPYSELFKEYSTNTKRNVKKATTYALQIETALKPEMIIAYRKKYLGEELKGTQNNKDQSRLQQLMEELIRINKGFIIGVSDTAGQILSLAFFIKSNAHLIFLSAVSSEEGKEKQAMTFLIDHVLKMNASSNLTFDFEGSMIPGLARYYKGFGGKEIQFSVISK